MENISEQLNIEKHKNNEFISISKLFGDAFKIPSYQRGYRWTRTQVEELLNDLKEFMDSDRAESDFYCLQPLVVAEYNTEYRVIDGQQRLTTIWLLLKCMGNKSIKIGYERPTMLTEIERYNCSDYVDISKSQTWSKHVDEKWHEFANEPGLQNVELYHLFAAKLFILNWLKHNEIKPEFINAVKVIWHLVPKDQERPTFKNMNSGKIPLTNSELIKALFLGSYGSNSTSTKINKAIIAEEFDQFEQTLRRPEFWYFLNNGDPQPTSCISLLFNILQAVKNPAADDRRYKNYNFFREQIKSVDEANRIWAEVRTVFHTLEGWYNNPEIYNLVGFIAACGASLTELYRNFIGSKNEDEFIAYLKYRCKELVEWKDIDDNEERTKYLTSTYRYDSKKQQTRRLLLLMNIASLNLHQTSDEREGLKRDISKFDFSDFHKCKWEVEHISPNNAVYRGGLEHLRFMVPYENHKTKEIPDANLRHAIDAYIATLDDSIMSLPNLTLLSKTINAGIGNEQFDEKRKDVIEKHSRGFYVLPCTMMVFTKAYLLKEEEFNREHREQKMNFWSDIDREVYISKISEILTRFFTGVVEVKPKNGCVIQSTAIPVFEDETTEVKKSIVSPATYKSDMPEEMTFSQLYSNGEDGYDYIIIPKIQRDYAQGRSSEADQLAATIRKNLLHDIFSGKEELDLDFQIIFGTNEQRWEIAGKGSQSKRVFIPIDGQQRLTTLFLLTLYHAKLNNIDIAPKFLYETRRAASDFCHAVTSNPWENGFPAVTPSEAITNSPWFMRYWKTDPTVDSMLRMLDAIHAKANESAWPNLNSIHFAFFDLGRQNSENIYLKMNSRGKELTAFENLKADIEENFKADIEENFINKLPEGWSKSLDGVWQDSFWTNADPTRVPDMPMLRFIANVIYVLSVNKFDNSNDHSYLKSLYDVAEKKLDDFVATDSFIEAINTYDCFDEKEDVKIGLLHQLKRVLDFHAMRYKPDTPEFSNEGSSCWQVAPVWNRTDYNPLLDSNYKQRAVMYAMILAINKRATKNSQMSEWLRFAWNLAENDVDDEKSFLTVCRIFKRLSELEGCSDILAVLKGNVEAQKLSSTAQFLEEIEKAKASDNSELFEAIKSVERHRLLRGAVRPLYALDKKSVWVDFTKKAENLSDLIPENNENRNTISLLIPYFEEEKLSEVFYHYYLSNEDSNIKDLLFQKKHEKIGIAQEMNDFLLKRNTDLKQSLLSTQLIDMAHKRLGWYYIRSGWFKNHQILTNYERATGYYQTESYVLANDTYNHLYTLLKEAGIIVSESKYPKGIFRDVRYKGALLRCYAENTTIRVMCQEGHLGQDELGRTFVSVTKDTTKEDLLNQLNVLSNYAADARFNLVCKFTDVMSGSVWGFQDNRDIPIRLDNEVIRSHEWVSVAELREGFSVCATISHNLNIEIGLRRLPSQTKKEGNPEMPRNFADYSTRNAWWYYVKNFPMSKADDAIEEIKLLLGYMRQTKNNYSTNHT